MAHGTDLTVYMWSKLRWHLLGCHLALRKTSTLPDDSTRLYRCQSSESEVQAVSPWRGSMVLTLFIRMAWCRKYDKDLFGSIWSGRSRDLAPQHMEALVDGTSTVHAMKVQSAAFIFSMVHHFHFVKEPPSKFLSRVQLLGRLLSSALLTAAST